MFLNKLTNDHQSLDFYLAWKGIARILSSSSPNTNGSKLGTVSSKSRDRVLRFGAFFFFFFCRVQRRAQRRARADALCCHRYLQRQNGILVCGLGNMGNGVMYWASTRLRLWPIINWHVCRVVCLNLWKKKKVTRIEKIKYIFHCILQEVLLWTIIF